MSQAGLGADDSLADLRHRLRTPLNHIVGYSELLLEEYEGVNSTIDEESLAQLKTIKANANLILAHIQHRLSTDDDNALSERLSELRTGIEEPLDLIIGNAARLTQRLRGSNLLDILRINAASMDLLWFAHGNQIAGTPLNNTTRPPDADSAAASPHPSRLLVVDDDEANCDVLRRQLERNGHSVTCVSRGSDALDALREEQFDLVLLDVIMPGMSGFDVLQEIKHTPASSDLPVIMMSALDELESAAHCIQMGAEDYLLKPFDPVLLRARLHSALERKRLHQAEKDRTQELEKASQNLKRANEDLHRFAFAASHDLQEPLRTVVTALQLLSGDAATVVSAEQRNLIGMAVDAAQRMRTLITDLLAYSLASGQDRVREVTSSEEALEAAMTNLHQSIEETGATITHDPLPRILFDRAHLGQLFQNLIGNAIKYRRSEPPKIHLTAARQGQDWIFSVRDNGMGIDGAHLKTIFEPFRRLHGRNLPGTGLGLPICERIVEGFGGRIWVESEPGKGSVFFFSAAAPDEGRGWSAGESL
ncbi:MAG TPA: response regulator [Bryobacteraceae bacterium]|jgi:signal transduction histidine kinase|nr:response regulator [Bryobacteraceae bacterium]